MKRFLILLLALLLTVGTFACGGKDNGEKTPEQPAVETEPTVAPAENAPAPAENTPQPSPEPAAEPAPAFAAGTYVLTAYQVGDAVIDGEMLVMSGMDKSTLTLNADRTGTLVMMDQTIDFSWTDDGDITFSGVSLYSMTQADDGTVTFNMGDAVMTFRPEGAEPTAAATEAPVEIEAPVETKAPVETEAPVVTEAPALEPQGEAAFPGAPYGTSDGVIDRAKLAGLYRWMHELPSPFLYALTFDEIGAAAGKQGHDRQDNDGKYQSATWSDGDRGIITVTFKDQGDGTYACTSIVISGVNSDEYNAADISGFPKIASSTPAGTNPTESVTLETKVGFSGPKVLVTAQIPNKNWYPQKAYIYCAPKEEKADRSQSYFKIECKESLEKIDFYKDSFENLTELAPRTIGGIEMQGRSYKNVGMDWIEYYGEVAEGVWVSIKLTGVDLSDGTETEAILLSLTFAVQ